MSHIYLTRLIIQTQSPMAISTGRRDTGFDTQLARDANGLPYIPATSIAGVWRNLVRNGWGDSIDNDWFGDTEQSSTITLADGVLHDAQNHPVQGLKTGEQIADDPILALLAQDRPHHREQVRINDRGVAAEEAKFDQLLLPTGVRFCVDLQWSDFRLTEQYKNDPDEGQRIINERRTQWQQLLGCWHNRLFALGATTRNGLGQIKVVASHQQTVNLKGNPAAAELLRAFANKTHIPITLDLPVATHQAIPFASLPLKALDNWRCGAGTELLGKQQSEHTIAMISYSEKVIQWQDDLASLSQKPLPILCGSSIKGMLAHRIAFHLRRYLGQWAEDMASDTHQQWQTRPDELKQLLGLADEEHSKSLAGRLFVDDCVIDFQRSVIRQHTSIDRFTGGVRQGALFNEELLYQCEFTLSLWLAPDTELSPALHQALTATLDDLKQGLLPLGAGSGRGTSLVIAHPNKPWQIDDSQINLTPNPLAEA
jgi:CRISPR/Cas system CMR subunit Cmr4 (Cas7 group RAMP superfamily)